MEIISNFLYTDFLRRLLLPIHMIYRPQGEIEKKNRMNCARMKYGYSYLSQFLLSVNLFMIHVFIVNWMIIFGMTV